MGKNQNKSNDKNQKGNKTHKTLRDKLRKRRQQLKQHKKQKSEKKKQYDALYQKSQFFNKGDKSQSKQLKMKKIIKHIEKFINIYEDDLNDFYQIFKLFDKGGKVDVSSIQNKALMKCLRKMFKYLPLKKQNGQYSKNQNSTISLEVFMKQKVSQCIEYYLQNGSHQASSQQSSGDQKQQHKEKKVKKQKKVKKEQQQEGIMGPIKLYKETLLPEPEQNMAMGPFIPESQKQKMAQLFQEQLQDLKREREQAQKIQPSQQQGDEFDQIFSMYQTRKQMKAQPVVSQQVPQHLMAAGSAKLGQKVQVDQASIDEYNQLNRPKKLIDVHKELMQSKGSEQPNKRKPFNRERDILGQGKTANFMKNSTFFDFRSKMTKPSNTNQFL